MTSRAKTARERAREQITGEIVAAARARLATEGPGELSLRAVARDVGMVSSAVYRYFASRDELLTALLVLAYDDLGAAAEQADAAVSDRAAFRERWLAVVRAIRRWAIEHPGDYALLYGSPVPGYAAPQTTVAPATRVIVVILAIITECHAAASTPATSPRSATTFDAAAELDADADAAAVAGAAAFVRDRGLVDAAGEVPTWLVYRTLMAWTTIFGTVSFELFGHLVGSVTTPSTYLDAVAARLADDLALPAGG